MREINRKQKEHKNQIHIHCIVIQKNLSITKQEQFFERIVIILCLNITDIPTNI